MPALVPEPVPVSERLAGFDFVLIQFHYAVQSIGFAAENRAEKI